MSERGIRVRCVASQFAPKKRNVQINCVSESQSNCQPE